MRILRNPKSIGAAMALTLAAAIPHAHAAANAPSWYVGVNGGQSDFRQRGGGVDDAFATQGLTTSSSFDDHATAWSIDGGLQLNRWFAIEANYVDFGKFDFSTTVSSPAADMIGGHFKARGEGLSVVGTYPLANNFSLFAKAGVLHTKAELEPDSTATTQAFSASRTLTNGWYGVGANYAITRNWSAQVQWDRYLRVGESFTTGRGDIDLVMAGVKYTF